MPQDDVVRANIRFAANRMSTAGGVVNSPVGIPSTVGKKHAAAVTNEMSDDSLRRAVEQSVTLAKLSPDDPEIMPALPPQTYLPVNGYFDSTANLSPEERARAALTALEPVRKAGDLKSSMLGAASSGPMQLRGRISVVPSGHCSPG